MDFDDPIRVIDDVPGNPRSVDLALRMPSTLHVGDRVLKHFDLVEIQQADPIVIDGSSLAIELRPWDVANHPSEV
jgi:hypothetical protein